LRYPGGFDPVGGGVDPVGGGVDPVGGGVDPVGGTAVPTASIPQPMNRNKSTMGSTKNGTRTKAQLVMLLFLPIAVPQSV